MNLPQVGEMFRGKYKLQAILGRGGFAAVYRATDTAIGRDVAIKMLAPGGGGYDPDVVSRFNREAHVIANLQDPHTITMFDFGRTEDGLLFMIFEYVAGEDLSEVLKRTGPLSPDTVAHVLEQLASALREAHAAGILHRDIKPANILVYHYMGDDFRVKLLDFGIAKPVEAAGVEELSITKTGAVVGTPRYMAPEQICGNELTPVSDVYSLGLIAYEMLVGAPAVSAKDTKAILLAQLSDKPLRLPADLPIDPQMRHIVEAMMAREPQFRVPSAEALMTDLAAVRKRTRPRRTTGQGPIQVPPGGSPPVHAPASNTIREPVIGPRVEPTVSQTITIETMKSAASTAAVGVIGVLLGAGVIIGLLSFVFGDDEPPEAVADIPVEQQQQQQVVQQPEAEPTTKSPPVPEGAASPKTAPAEAAPDPAAKDAGTADVVVAPIPGEQQGDKTGCGEAPPFVGEKNYVTRIRGVERSWTTYLPKGYDPNVSHPVVLVFHNTNISGSAFVGEFKAASDRHGFVVMGPTSPHMFDAWKDPTDMVLLKQMVKTSSETLCLDRHRVFAVGHASGGRMVEQIRCQMALSGMAASGYRSRPRCEQMEPVPYMYLWGNKDPYLPKHGGSACNAKTETSLQQQHDVWKHRNACTGEARRYSSRRDGKCVAWTCEKAPFVSCEINGGHHWAYEPPALHFPTCDSGTSAYPYAEEIWKFFEKEGVSLKEPFG